jgi:short subunit dehydrogenase-like uncharacterized protein
MEWLIYGANGYSGALIACEAQARGLRPILAGRSAAVQALANELGLEARSFSLHDPQAVRTALAGVGLVLHCAGPFSATAAPMVAGCLAAGSHYLDITGEIAVFEAIYARHEEARARGVMLCPGVGFDVVPTDCVALGLKRHMPDATHLSLGFDSRSGLSPGTAKTSIEGLAGGGRARIGGRLCTVPLGWRTREIDFGNGIRHAVTIPWGDIASAWRSTGIPNIETYVPASPRMTRRLRHLDWVRPVLAWRPVQALIKAQIARRLRGPDQTEREAQLTWVWGEARNPEGRRCTARVRTANGYDLTIHAALAVVEALLGGLPVQTGATTPGLLFGPGLVERLPGSLPISYEYT